jgi:hypothetical protein
MIVGLQHQPYTGVSCSRILRVRDGEGKSETAGLLVPWGFGGTQAPTLHLVSQVPWPTLPGLATACCLRRASATGPSDTMARVATSRGCAHLWKPARPVWAVSVPGTWAGSAPPRSTVAGSHGDGPGTLTRVGDEGRRRQGKAARQAGGGENRTAGLGAGRGMRDLPLSLAARAWRALPASVGTRTPPCFPLAAAVKAGF